MRRAPFVIAGTVVGVAAVLGYPTHHGHLVIPAQSAGTTPGSTGTAGPTPATTPGATPGATTPGASTPGASTPASTTPATTAPPNAVREATGADQPYQYGDLAVQVKVTGTRITDVVMSQLNDGGGRSQDIDQQAIPLLRQQVLAAQSTNINGVSGATYTSQAYVDSVQSALDQLGVK